MIRVPMSCLRRSVSDYRKSMVEVGLILACHMTGG